MTQAIAYIRRSTDKQDESLTQQRAQLEAFARSKGWTLKQVYEDDAISGSDMNRPGLEQMLRDASTQTDIEIVLAWDRNRLARPKEPLDGMLLERKLREAGKRIVYASNGREADASFAGGLLGYVEHYQNGDYLRKLSRDTIRGIVDRVARGLWPGGPIPFGYDRLILDSDKTPRRIIRDMEDGSQVILDPLTGETVERLAKGKRHKKQDHESCTLIPSDAARVHALQRVFADFAAGKATRTLCDQLNRSGFRTSRGSHFTPQTILPILENRAYLGECIYNRRTESKWNRYELGRSVERQDEGIEHRPESDWIVTPDAWPALIERDAFDRVQQRRGQSKQENRHTTGSATKAGYLLTGRISCGVCGGRLTGQTKTSGKKSNGSRVRKRYYVCSTHHNGHHDRCPNRYSVPADVVEQYILALIREDLAKLRDDDKLHEYIEQELLR